MAFYPFMASSKFSVDADLFFLPPLTHYFSQTDLRIDLLALSPVGGLWEAKRVEIEGHVSAMKAESVWKILGLASNRQYWVTVVRRTFELPEVISALECVDTLTHAQLEWRGRINFKDATGVEASYLGEVGLFAGNKSLLSFIPFVFNPAATVYKFIFLNLTNKANMETDDIVFHMGDNGACLGRFEATTNIVNVFDITKLLNHEDWVNNYLAVRCNEITGIPLLFAMDEKNCFGTIEHSHPPASSFFGPSRFEAHSLLKNNWVHHVLE